VEALFLLVNKSTIPLSFTGGRNVARTIKEVTADYVKDQTTRGSMKSGKDLKDSAKIAVRTEIFQVKKFVNEGEMNSGGQVCRLVLNAMGYHGLLPDEMTRVWTIIKDTVRKTFDEKRSTTNTGIKTEWLRKYKGRISMWSSIMYALPPAKTPLT
jgi:hypothetical protein